LISIQELRAARSPAPLEAGAEACATDAVWIQDSRANSTSPRPPCASLRDAAARDVAGLRATVAADGGGDVTRITLAKRARERGFTLRSGQTDDGAIVVVMPPPTVPIAALGRGVVARAQVGAGTAGLSIVHAELGSTAGLPLSAR
jgi:hypothetical protein